MTTGTKIRILREQKKMSQEALAYAVGVSQVTIGNWEQGKSIRHAFINKLAVALNVSSDFLLDDSQVSTHTHTHTHRRLKIKIV